MLDKLKSILSIETFDLSASKRNSVQVINSADKNPLYEGNVIRVKKSDDGHVLLVVKTSKRIMEIDFDNVASLSRMRDGRLRIWIK